MKSSSKEKARRASKKPMHFYFFDSLNRTMQLTASRRTTTFPMTTAFHLAALRAPARST